MSRQPRQDVTPASGLLGLWSSVLLCSLLCTVGYTADTPAKTPQPEQSVPQALPQERFLQHFISQSLGKEAPQGSTTPTPAAVTAPAPLATAAQGVPGRPTVPPPVDLTTTTLKMVLALGGMLGLLGLLAYGVRRYLQDQNPAGKRQGVLRVIARTSLTPKASVALVEVPGKILVIGITGTSLTALGEVDAPVGPAAAEPVATATEPLPNPTPPSPPPASFSVTLDESTEALLSTEAMLAEPRRTAMRLRMSEAIQQKVSQLKQL